MELVDMQGLKPCPRRGPGSSPGTGNIAVHFSVYKFLSFMLALSILFIAVGGLDMLCLLVSPSTVIFKTLPPYLLNF
jgi:hypothetical protein